MDRSGAYFCRYVARQLVNEGLARRVEIQVAYAIGVAQPVSVRVSTFGTGDEAHVERTLPQAPEWGLKEKLAGEKEMLGFYVTGHPLDQFEDKVRELATNSSSNVEGLEKNTEVALCGVVTALQRKRNREGKPWVSMVLEDRDGGLDAMVFTTNYERLASLVVEDQVVLVRGFVLPEENAPPKISVQDIVPLEVARVPLPSLIS